jgi:predicted dehydrogenase
MAQMIRWGILGTGRIAHTFAAGLRSVPDVELVAVGSRSQQAAERFGDEMNVPRRHASYEELANDPDVDVIYVSSPHSAHMENSLLCINAGKAVLCEKPFTINARQAEAVISAARTHGVFLMEAMWPRFLPAMVRVRELLAEQAIGEVRMLASDCGFRTSFDPQHRLFNPELGGGALLDVGVYPISLSSMIFGEPERITSLASLGATGVDEQSAMILGYSAGQLAILSTAIRTSTPNEAHIMGSDGTIRIHSSAVKATTLTVSRSGKQPETIELPLDGNGYNYQAAAVADALRAGKRECDIMPLDETLSIMRTMDRIREQWQLTYPME